MNVKKIFFDFDETLVDTTELDPYRRTSQGREFVAEHPDEVNTRLINPDLLTLFNELAQKNLIAIATNSAENYTKKLMEKHGFFSEIPIYYNLHKPCCDKLLPVIRMECKKADDALLIGDSASDIIASHGCCMPSVAVTWGNTSTIDDLEMAEPTKIANTVSELKTHIKSFEDGKLAYERRLAPDNFLFLYDFIPLGEQPNDAKIEYHQCCQYYPIGHPFFYYSFSNDVLRFKDIKCFSIEEIKKDIVYTYFNNNKIIKNLVLKQVFTTFYNKLIKQIENLNLKGTSYIVAAPNSSPEYCYKCDVNQIMANKLNQKILSIDNSFLKRIMYRVHPKMESHLNGRRDKSEHYKTIGIRKDATIPGDLDNLIIFDDVSTTHTQLNSLADIMRTIFNFNGNIIGLTLGQTAQ